MCNMNTLKVEFVSEYDRRDCAFAYPIYEDALESCLNWMRLALEQKKNRDVIECYMPFESIFERHILINLHSKKACTKRILEEAGSALLKKVSDGDEKVLLLNLKGCSVDALNLLTGMMLASFKFNKYKTVLRPSENRFLEKIIVLCDEPKIFQERFKRINAQIEGTLYARSLTSEPPNVLYPKAYAERLKELEGYGIEVEILDKHELETIGMTAILAVSQGSQHNPSVVIMKWMGSKDKTESPIALVGKGVCFDAGGLCLKSAPHQFMMKWDKAGAGVVAGTMKTLAMSKAHVNVIGIVGLVENMPDGAALKPGDIIHTMSSQTVEIENTDAEGRLVLADCLYYVENRFSPKVIIDLGTLTMETFASLGNSYAGLYGTSEILNNELKIAGVQSGDLLWELPMGESFAKQIESNVADMKNLGVEHLGENGAAAEFLKRFVKNTPWAHLDIAGVSWTDQDLPLSEKGVTGFGVRLLDHFIQGK